MFDLMTKPEVLDENKKNFTGVIIDNDGMLKTFHYVLEGSYYSDVNTKIEYDTYIDTFKNKIITIGNVSKFDTLEPRKLVTDSIQIESTKDFFFQKAWNEGVWGNNLMDCLHLGLRNAIFAKIYEGGRNVPDMNTSLVPYLAPPDSLPLRLVVLTDDGLKVINGLVHHEFQDDRNEGCPSCVQGFITYEETLDKIGRHIIAGTQNAKFNGAYIHDMDVSSNESITNSLYEAFRQTILIARIKTIRFEELK